MPRAAGPLGWGAWAPDPIYRGAGPTHPSLRTVPHPAEIPVSSQTRHIRHDASRPGATISRDVSLSRTTDPLMQIGQWKRDDGLETGPARERWGQEELPAPGWTAPMYMIWTDLAQPLALLGR